jgi:hypothetical protein
MVNLLDFFRTHKNLKLFIRRFHRLRRANELEYWDDDGLVKSLLKRHPGESRGPEHPEITGFRLSPE